MKPDIAYAAAVPAATRAPTAPVPWVRRPESIYSAGLLVAAVATFGLVGRHAAEPLYPAQPAAAVFFIIWGLFTISAGYEHPRIGYVSFDRVAQVASILVLGPLTAAWVTGLASLLFPWRRLWSGAPLGKVLIASMNNAGLMTLMVLGSGLLYQALGGPVPLDRLDLHVAVLLAVLILSMQVLNEIGLGIHLYLRDRRWRTKPSRFVLGLESGAGVAAVLLAMVFSRMELQITVLLLVVLSAGMLALAQFARMRVALEAIVEERTRVLREKTLELEHLATRDQLTGLFNRRYVDGYLDRRIDEFNRYARGFTIALIDIDRFKRVNDEHSHELGDEVLKRVAATLVERCRASDIVARYGGEEFLLCFPEAGREAVTHLCEALRQAVAATDWARIGITVPVSLSGGVAEMQPGMGRSELVDAADRKLYAAKDAGRNLVFS